MMKGSSIQRWTALAGVLGIGMLVGLVIAGSWNVTPSGFATADPGTMAVIPADQGAAATEPAIPAGSYRVPDELLRRDAYAGPAGQQVSGSALREAAARARPAVVRVEVQRVVRGATTMFNFDPDEIPEQMREYFRFEFPQQEEDLQPRLSPGSGSGFIFSRDGYIITNNHVIDGAVQVTVTLPDRRRFLAEIVGADVITDIAVLKIDANGNLPVVSLGDSDAIGIGDTVLALGNPLIYNFTVTAGIVSAMGRGNLPLGPVEGNVNQMIQDFIQTDAAINPGNSGGPLVDLGGNVIGINTAIASQTGFNEGYGFAVPINLARIVARDLIEHGEVQRAWLGITFTEITADWAEAISLPDTPPLGAVVQTVVEGGPAEEAGIEEQDVITKLDGRPVEHSGQLQTLVSTTPPGTRIKVEVYRGGSRRSPGERLELTVRLGERPPLARPETETLKLEVTDPLGLELDEMTRQERRQADFQGEALLVEGVETGSPFGIGVVDWILVEVDRQPVTDLESYERIVSGLQKGDAVLVTFYNPSGPEDNRYQTVAVRVP